MGTGFMIDAPLRVAKYGISSVLSLVDDLLIEQMRELHCLREGEPFEPIHCGEDDARARRITAYLNLLDRLVARQVAALRASPFEPQSEIARYFELLPPSPPKTLYQQMLATVDPGRRAALQAELRELIVPGNIDANIMVKGDRDAYHNGEKLPAMFSDALAALRGFALSTVRASMVFSAGLNPRLYSYAAEFPDFFPGEDGELKKKIILKVSDYRSAEIQGKFLAKRGLWISEYRIESGLNCGGHAFPTKGLLLGPILEEFQSRKAELVETLHKTYVRALGEHGHAAPAEPLPVLLTVQGGIGTAEEDALLREHYRADATGWGTPFLLVPEVTNVDDEHLRLLADASAQEVYLSDSSPFGVPFWNLRTSASEEARRRRIAEGHPGSPCSRGFVKLFNTEFTERPICTASRQYQKRKLEKMLTETLTDEQRQALLESVLAKSCICHDLAGGATLKHGIEPDATTAVCCGPNIVYFSKVASLEDMVGHIYGRTSLLNGAPRPHMLLREIELYLDYLREDLKKYAIGLPANGPKYFEEYRDNLLSGVEHYRLLASRFSEPARSKFLADLQSLRTAIETVELPRESDESK